MCIAGDTWSQRQTASEQELLDVLNGLRQQHEVLLKNSHKNRLRQKQQEASTLKATLKHLKRGRCRLSSKITQADHSSGSLKLTEQHRVSSEHQPDA